MARLNRQHIPIIIDTYTDQLYIISHYIYKKQKYNL